MAIATLCRWCVALVLAGGVLPPSRAHAHTELRQSLSQLCKFCTTPGLLRCSAGRCKVTRADAYVAGVLGGTGLVIGVVSTGVVGTERGRTAKLG